MSIENISQNKENNIDNIKIEIVNNDNLNAIILVDSILSDSKNVNDIKLFEKLKLEINKNHIDLSIFKKYNPELLKWVAICMDNELMIDELKNNKELLNYKNIKPEDIDSIILEIRPYINKIKPIIKENYIYYNKETNINFNEKLNKIQNFFKFNNLDINKINIILDNPFNIKNSGFCFNVGNDVFINMNSYYEDTFTHEFLHTKINRIIENLKIDDEFSNMINETADKRLIKDYGEFSVDNKSVLFEEFIRTYEIYFSHGKSIDEKHEEVEKLLDKDKGIKLLKLYNKTKEQALKEIKDNDKLKNCIYKFYYDYSKQSLSFEEYIKFFPIFLRNLQK